MVRIRSRELFPTDGPVPPDRMIGRREEADDLGRTLRNGLHRIVVGPRRIGKTTLCRAALVNARKSGCYVVELDLFAIPTRAELAEVLVTRTIANRPALHKAVQKLRRAGRTLVKGAALSAAMKAKTDFGDEIEVAFRPGLAVDDPDRYLAYALELPQRVAEADGRQLILFIDEFQELANDRRPYGDPDSLTKQMRSVFQDADRVTCLFAGSVEHVMRDLFTPRHRAFFQFGGFHELGRIDEGDWWDGLRKRFAEDGCTIDDAAISRLLTVSEGHPRVTMLVAQQTHDASIALATTTIDLALVEQGYEIARAVDRANHELTVERLRSIGKHTLVVARRIARGESTYAGLEAKTGARTVSMLRGVGLIEQEAPRRWKITDPLLRRYLAELGT